MTPEERRELIQRYGAGLEAIQIALFHIGEHGLDEAPEGEWTPRQIVHHLADAELFRSVRLRQLLSEDDPLLATLDGDLAAANADYSRPIDSSLHLLRASITANMEIINRLPEEAWQRTGHLALGDRFSLSDWLGAAANHGFEHAAQLEANAIWHTAGVHSTS